MKLQDTLYVIRHKATGELMPELEGRRRGYSHWNPAHFSQLKKKTLNLPRFLTSRSQATRVIAQWAANPNARQSFSIGYDGEENFDIVTVPDGRQSEDLEVVQVACQIIENV